MIIPLATYGFTIAGIAFAFYANNFLKLANKYFPKSFAAYSYAYALLALAFFIWGFSALLPQYLHLSVLLGDGLILFGTFFLINILLDKESITSWSVVLGLGVATAFLFLRIVAFPANPVLSNGVIIFNTQPLIALILGLIFVGLWFPANIKIGRMVSSQAKDIRMGYIYTVIHSIAILSAMLFLIARQPSGVIWTFLLLTLSFISLLFTNNFVGKILNKEPGYIEGSTEAISTNNTPVKENKTAIKIGNIIILFYVIGIAAAFFNDNKQFDGLLALLSIILGALAAGSLMGIMTKIAKGKSAAAKVGAGFVGVLGGVALFVIGLFAALISSMKHVQGD